jgi:hypothetical protein
MALIDRLQKELQKQNLATNTKKAREWIRDKVKDLSRLDRTMLLRDNHRKRKFFYLGSMYFFVYNPKLRNDLPFYDLFPLVIPIDYTEDGFLGLNLHYLAPVPRARLLDKLIHLTEIHGNKMALQYGQLAASYQMLKSLSGVEVFKPCVKRYISSQIRSKFLRIDANEWEIAIHLPVESFIGASKATVFSKSRKKY